MRHVTEQDSALVLAVQLQAEKNRPAILFGYIVCTKWIYESETGPRGELIDLRTNKQFRFQTVILMSPGLHILMLKEDHSGSADQINQLFKSVLLHNARKNRHNTLTNVYSLS